MPLGLTYCFEGAAAGNELQIRISGVRVGCRSYLHEQNTSDMFGFLCLSCSILAAVSHVLGPLLTQMLL